MNEQIRETVKRRMAERGETQAEVAAALGMGRGNLNRLLTGSSGQVPETWQRLLDYLSLSLSAVPTAGAVTSQTRAQQLRALAQELHASADRLEELEARKHN